MSTEEEYFLTAIQLWKNYNLYDILDKGDVYPDKEYYYYTDEIRKALKYKIELLILYLDLNSQLMFNFYAQRKMENSC